MFSIVWESPGQFRTADGSRVLALPGRVDWIDFSRHETGRYFVAHGVKNDSVVWHSEGLYPLVRFAAAQSFYFAPDQTCLVVEFHDQSTYLVDLVWLEAMGGYPVRLSGSKLAQVACTPFFNGKLFTTQDERRLVEEHLKPLGIEPQACQREQAE